MAIEKLRRRLCGTSIRGRAGVSLATALRETQLAMLSGALKPKLSGGRRANAALYYPTPPDYRQRDWSHPFFWGAFRVDWSGGRWATCSKSLG